MKIRHVKTGLALHSHTSRYTTGSLQQEVTCFGSRDENDWWCAKGPNGESRFNCLIATPILNHSIIRLEHILTERNLHSHGQFQSPDTHQGEVTCYGEFGRGDDNDNWRVEVVGQQAGAPWRADQQFKLVHMGTNHTLHSHHGHHTHTHEQEVTAFSHNDDNDLWVVEVNS